MTKYEQIATIILARSNGALGWYTFNADRGEHVVKLLTGEIFHCYTDSGDMWNVRRAGGSMVGFDRDLETAARRLLEA